MDKYSIILLIWNIIVMLVYGLDKMKAKNGRRRIRESSLLIISYLFGGYGAVFGMILFNHKTSKIKFRILVPLSTVFNVLLIYYILKILTKY